MKIFHLPDLGEGLADATVREWYVQVGDAVKIDQPLLSMETAKAVVDVPAPLAGRVTKLYGAVGDVINTGEPLIAFDGAEEMPVKTKDAGTVVGKIEVGDRVITEPAAGLTIPSPAAKGIKATPAVRALAKKLGIDLAAVTPSGPGGSITAADVQQGVTATPVRAPAKTETAVEGPVMSALRRAMAVGMAKSHAEIVPVTLVDEADIHAWPAGEDFTLRIIRALCAACRAEPALNAHYDGKAMRFQPMGAIHLGLAIDTREGLYVPVIRDVAEKSPAELREIINRFKAQAQTHNIAQHDLHGATITLTNFGTIAGRYASPVILPPQVAIIGTGVARDAVVAHRDQVVIHRVLPLSVTIDHRAVTGGEASRFLAAFIKAVSDATI